MNDLLCCSFCGKNERNDRVRVIAGPCVYICEECVEVCVEILRSTKIEVRDVLDEERRARAEQKEGVR